MTGAAPQLRERLAAALDRRGFVPGPDIDDAIAEALGPADAKPAPPRTPLTCAGVCAMSTDLAVIGNRLDRAAIGLLKAYGDSSDHALHAALREMRLAHAELYLLIERAEIAAHKAGGRDD